MKRSFTYLISVAVALGLLSSCSGPKAKPLPQLKETYSKADKKPFGGNLAYRQMEAMFYLNSVRIKKTGFDKTWNEISNIDTSSLYVCIAPALHVNDQEALAMMDYVYAGNDLFIAAGFIDEFLLSRMGINGVFYPDPYRRFDSMRTTATGIPASAASFSYYYLPFKNYFSNIDKPHIKVLGLNEAGAPNHIVYFFGKGRLFLHADPRAFSNYFLLQKDNFKYLQHAFSYTHAMPFHLYWDDHYNKINQRRRSRSNNDKQDDSFSSFSEINKHPPLAAAFWLSLLLLLLYILFGSKRLQRVINKVKPNENTTLTYTETIGRLYLQKKDNKNIAEKMITYFNEYIRNKYFLNSTVINNEFITTLSRKTGMQRADIESLYRAIDHAQKSATLDDYQLLSLNEQIQNFYKNRN